MIFLFGLIKVEFGFDLVQVGLLVSLSFFGMVIGVVLLGMFVDCFGCKLVFQVSIVFWGLVSYLCFIVGDFDSLIFYWVLLGIGMGMEFFIVQLLLLEMILVSCCGKYIVLMDGFWLLGFVVVGCLFYFLLLLIGWCSIFLVLVLLVVFVFVICFLIFELLCWLEQVGWCEQVDWVLCDIEVWVMCLLGLIELLLLLCQLQWECSCLGFFSVFVEFWLLVYWCCILIVWGLWFFVLFGFYGLIFWFSVLFQ